MAKLLVVDDEKDMRTYMKVALEKHSHSITLADGPSEAVACLRDATFDAVLLDIDMPEMDGVTFTRVLTNTPTLLGHPDVPIVLVTGRDDPGIIGESFDAGARYFLRKPFSPKELLHAVQLVLEA